MTAGDGAIGAAPIGDAGGALVARRADGARRHAPRRRPALAGAFTALVGLGFVGTIALAVTTETTHTLARRGGVEIAIGHAAGLLGAYGIIVMVLLSARVPWLERAIGQTGLIAWHRRLGPWPLLLIAVHATFTLIGYAAAQRSGVLAEFGRFTGNEDVLFAMIGAGILLLAGVSSYRRLRRRLAYQTWWRLHLYIYLGLFFAFGHQISTGQAFVDHPVARIWWISMWAGTLALVICFRATLPVLRSGRHGLEVARVIPSGPGLWSVIFKGRELDRLPVSGGQFFRWRFEGTATSNHYHPYSISALPGGNRMRITVKAVGADSAGIADLAPGDRVGIEGPYGGLTADRLRGDRVLLIGAGVGSAPLRSLLEDLDPVVDVVVILRASTRAELVLRDEFAAELAGRGGRLIELVGSRATVALDRESLSVEVPDLADRDVFICGPDGFTATVVRAVRAAGVPWRRVHRESFSF